jgi:hypothetical protein
MAKKFRKQRLLTESHGIEDSLECGPEFVKIRSWSDENEIPQRAVFLRERDNPIVLAPAVVTRRIVALDAMA